MRYQVQHLFILRRIGCVSRPNYNVIIEVPQELTSSSAFIYT